MVRAPVKGLAFATLMLRRVLRVSTRLRVAQGKKLSVLHLDMVRKNQTFGMARHSLFSTHREGTLESETVADKLKGPFTSRIVMQSSIHRGIIV